MKRACPVRQARLSFARSRWSAMQVGHLHVGERHGASAQLKILTLVAAMRSLHNHLIRPCSREERHACSKCARFRAGRVPRGV